MAELSVNISMAASGAVEKKVSPEQCVVKKRKEATNSGIM